MHHRADFGKRRDVRDGVFHIGSSQAEMFAPTLDIQDMIDENIQRLDLVEAVEMRLDTAVRLT